MSEDLVKADGNPNYNKPIEVVKKVATGENLQKYVLGTKKNGAPRAIYDIFKDCYLKPKKHKKKKHKKHKKHVQPSAYDLYVGIGKKKKKKHKKKSKHWHI